ncbi:MAG: MFS transporter [Clostridia bacterium]
MKIRLKNTISIGFAFLSIMILWQGYNWFVPLFLNGKLEKIFIDIVGDTGAAKFIVGAIMGLDNLVALFMIPLVSKLSDRTNTKIGKRVPFIIVGLSIALLGFAAVPFVADGSLVLLILVLMLIMVAMNVYRSPAVALMPDITPKPLRARSNAIINIMGGVGTGLGYLTCYICSEKILNMPDTVPILFISFVMFICLLLILLTIKEDIFKRQMHLDVMEYCKKTNKNPLDYTDTNEEKDVEKQLKKSKATKRDKKNLRFMLMSIFFYYMAANAVETFISLYSDEVLGDLAHGLEMLAALAVGNFGFMIPAAMIAEKIGRRNTMLIGSGLMLTGNFILTFVNSFSYFLIIPFFIFGIGMALMVTNMYPTVVGFCGKGDYARYTGLYYSATMIAQSITPALAGLFMSQFFGGNTINLMPYSAVFTLLCLVALLFIDKNQKAERKNENKEKL